jgi:hypothetical protein
MRVVRGSGGFGRCGSALCSTQNLGDIFSKWDVCTLGKCKMDVRRMVCRVASAYAANVLPELEALIKSEHKPVVERTKAGKAAKARAPWQAPGRAHGTTASGSLLKGRPPDATDPWRGRRPFVF